MADWYYDQKMYERAVAAYSKLADKGHIESMYSLGYCYWRGQGVKKDLKLAKHWLTKAADEGHKKASERLVDIKAEEKNGLDLQEKRVAIFVHGMIFKKNNAGGLAERTHWRNSEGKDGMIGNFSKLGWKYRGRIWFKPGSAHFDREETAIGGDGFAFYTLSFSEAANADGFGGRVTELKRAIEIVKKAEGVSKVVLVGHSAGGLVSRAYLQSAGINFEHDVEHLVTIATPHMGAISSYLAKQFDALGFRADSMTPDAPLIKSIDDGELKLPRDVKFTSLIARCYNQLLVKGTPKSDYLNHVCISPEEYERLPFALKTGFDGITQVLSQNLALTKAGMEYERESGMPVNYAIIAGVKVDEEWHNECILSEDCARLVDAAIKSDPVSFSKVCARINLFANEFALMEEELAGPVAGTIRSINANQSVFDYFSGGVSCELVACANVGGSSHNVDTSVVYISDHFGRLAAKTTWLPVEVDYHEIPSSVRKDLEGGAGLFVDYVSDCGFNSIAANYGISKDDRLLSYDGISLVHSIRNQNPLRDAIASREGLSYSRGKVPVIFFRPSTRCFYKINVPTGRLLGVNLSAHKIGGNK